jgi:hypothetical protein
MGEKKAEITFITELPPLIFASRCKILKNPPLDFTSRSKIPKETGAKAGVFASLRQQDSVKKGV